MIADKQLTDGGIATMKDSALLAILLSSERGNYFTIERSTTILQACQNSLNTLYSLPIEELLQLDGLTYTDAIRLKCSLELKDIFIINDNGYYIWGFLILLE